jgi:D-hexose-6-phosphate mutarotase
MIDKLPILTMSEHKGVEFVRSTDLYPALHKPGDEGLPLLLVENDLGRAVISLQGAQLLAFKPVGQQEMLWLSPQSFMQKGKAIRGGIPLCLPWFGTGSDGKSMHGFARTRHWSVVNVQTVASGETQLSFELQGNSYTCELWPHDFSFRLDVSVGRSLTLTLTAENRSDQVAPLAFAFHTYFAVPDIRSTHVAGLDGATYADKDDAYKHKKQVGDVSISGYTDRIYLDVAESQVIKTPAGEFRIEGDSSCAVVWNAWTGDKNMPDLGEGNHATYICVERGDLYDRAVSLKPGTKYQTWMTLSS